MTYSHGELLFRIPNASFSLQQPHFICKSLLSINAFFFFANAPFSSKMPPSLCKMPTVTLQMPLSL